MFDDYPRPQLSRAVWTDLSGPWSFAHDDDDRGRAATWSRGFPNQHSITVPYPPESAASGIGDGDLHPIVWYSRPLGLSEVASAGHAPGNRLLLHFGAVDYRCEVWLDGQFLGSHEGGHTPFSFDIAGLLEEGTEWLLVLRVEDDPLDAAQPRGKQDWQTNPHSIWYERTTGIWQPVWLESTPPVAIESVHWTFDRLTSSVTASVRLNGRPTSSMEFTARLELDGEPLGATAVEVSKTRFAATLHLPDLDNGQDVERLLWSPASPTLVAASLELRSGGGHVDRVKSYVGLRTVTIDSGHFLLNDRPLYVRAVLEQGYWPDSHLAAPSSEALRAEVELIKSAGFNTVRLHQKYEDPRFLAWADRLGLLIWAETPGAYEFSPTAVGRMTHEWLEVLDRDRSHPSIVTWVPLNESWGVQDIAHSPAMQAYARSLADLTRAIDPTRPVISNDGWEHVNSDLLTIHDYEASPEVITRRYSGATTRQQLLASMAPAGRRLTLGNSTDESTPIILSEFGGISYSTTIDGAWGYSHASSEPEYRKNLQGLVLAVRTSELLQGFCYTQLTDTAQEQNGLFTAAREPKLPIEELRRIFGAQDEN